MTTTIKVKWHQVPGVDRFDSDHTEVMRVPRGMLVRSTSVINDRVGIAQTFVECTEEEFADFAAGYMKRQPLAVVPRGSQA
jgi:hypothetical protein